MVDLLAAPWRRSAVARLVVTRVGCAAVLGTGDDPGAGWLSCHEVDGRIGRQAIGSEPIWLLCHQRINEARLRPD